MDINLIEKGGIIGGTPLLSDPDLKAFQVGKEDITFTYMAPDEEGSQAAEDKIVIYNSCDILREDEYPMPKTELKDKIAEKRINLIHADAILKMTENYKFTTEDGTETSSSTVNVVLKYTHTESFADEGVFIEHYDIISWNVSNAIANISAGTRNYETQKVDKDDQKTEKLVIYFDSKTGKAKYVTLPDVRFWFIFDDLYDTRVEWVGAMYGKQQDIKGGDGIHEMEGDEAGAEGGLEYTGKWEIKRYK